MRYRRYSTILFLSLFCILICSLTLSAEDRHIIVIKKVIDGDTLRVLYDGKEEKLRLIGMDAPESRINPRAEKQSASETKELQTILKMGRGATNFVRSLVKPGDRLKIEFDVVKRDRYQRLLGYVYLSNGKMLNEEIVKAGYANLLTIPPNVRYQGRFIEAHVEAREHKRGFWKQ